MKASAKAISASPKSSTARFSAEGKAPAQALEPKSAQFVSPFAVCHTSETKPVATPHTACAPPWLRVIQEAPLLTTGKSALSCCLPAASHQSDWARLEVYVLARRAQLVVHQSRAVRAVWPAQYTKRKTGRPGAARVG